MKKDKTKVKPPLKSKKKENMKWERMEKRDFWMMKKIPKLKNTTAEKDAN